MDMRHRFASGAFTARNPLDGTREGDVFMSTKSRLCLAALALSTVMAQPAVAQTQAQQQRWDNAQRRFDSERRVYESERQIYENSRRGGGWRSDDRYGRDDNRYDRDDRNDRDDDRYDRDDDRNGRNDAAFDESRFQTQYDASRYYRSGTRYRERALTAQDEVYRGSDGRYYCKRTDGTTGLIVGGAGGAILGNVIDGGRNRAAGTLIGGALGALLGRQVERANDVRCR